MFTAGFYIFLQCMLSILYILLCILTLVCWLSQFFLVFGGRTQDQEYYNWQFPRLSAFDENLLYSFHVIYKLKSWNYKYSRERLVSSYNFQFYIHHKVYFLIFNAYIQYKYLENAFVTYSVFTLITFLWLRYYKTWMRICDIHFTTIYYIA